MIDPATIELKDIVFMIAHSRRLGMELVEDGEDHIIVRLPYKDELASLDGQGIMANGAIISLMDTALGAAVFKQFGKIKKIATLDLRMDFFGPAKAFQPVLGRVSCTKVTRELVFARGDFYCEDETELFGQCVAVFSHQDLPFLEGQVV